MQGHSSWIKQFSRVSMLSRLTWLWKPYRLVKITTTIWRRLLHIAAVWSCNTQPSLFIVRRVNQLFYENLYLCFPYFCKSNLCRAVAYRLASSRLSNWTGKWATNYCFWYRLIPKPIDGTSVVSGSNSCGIRVNLKVYKFEISGNFACRTFGTFENLKVPNFQNFKILKLSHIAI